MNPLETLNETVLLYVLCVRSYEVFTWLCVGVDADGGPLNGSDGGNGNGNGSMCYPNMPICLPCWLGCKSCQDGTPCWVQEAWLLRGGVLAVQGVFMLLIFISMLVAYRHRRNRVSQFFWLNGGHRADGGELFQASHDTLCRNIQLCLFSRNVFCFIFYLTCLLMQTVITLNLFFLCLKSLMHKSLHLLLIMCFD